MRGLAVEQLKGVRPAEVISQRRLGRKVRVLPSIDSDLRPQISRLIWHVRFRQEWPHPLIEGHISILDWISQGRKIEISEWRRLE
jgi:hypothetical protein